MLSIVNRYCLIILLLVTCKLWCVAPDTVIYTIPNNVFPNFTQLEFIAITPDGTKAYVTDQENNFVYIINLATNTVTGKVTDLGSTFNEPFGIAITPDGSKAYVTNFSNATVSIINVATDTVVGTVTDLGSTINTPYAVAFTPNGTKAYVTNKFSLGTVSVINVATDTVTGTVTDGSSTINVPTAVAFTPDGSTAYVANIGNNTVSIINVETNTVTGIVTDGSSTFQTPLGIAFTPDGTKAYVANNDFFGASVSVVDVSTNTVTGKVTDSNPATLLQPIQIAITPDGSTAYVTNNGSFWTVSMINVATDSAIGRVNNDDFSSSTGLAITPDGLRVYVVNTQNNTISVIGTNSETSPTNIKGCKTKNVFLAQTDYINKITWQPPVSGNAPVSYSLYRDAALTQLITAVPATVLHYYDHNTNPALAYSYYITAVDVNGNVSALGSVVVTQPC